LRFFRRPAPHRPPSLSQRRDPELDQALVPRAELAPDHRPHPDRRLLPLDQLRVELLRHLLAEPGQLVLARLELARSGQQLRQELDLRLDERQEIGAPPHRFEELVPIGHDVGM
jgi:hypothetical protein